MEDKQLLKPKVDVVFHALFRKENKHLTEALISDILGEKIKVKTTDKDKEMSRKTADDKLGILDLRTELEGGDLCNIEIQVAERKYEKERFLLYWADSYCNQLEKGDLYDKLHKTISIIILDHELKELKGIEELGTKWQIRDEKTGKRMLTNHLEIVIIEIPKAKRIYEKNGKDRISQWMIFFDDPNKKEVSRIMEDNKKIKEAVEELHIVSKDEELRRIAQLREKAIRDEAAALELAIERGMKQGIEQGLEQGLEQGIEKGAANKAIEIAKNMLQEKFTIETIIKITGLKKEEIDKLI